MSSTSLTLLNKYLIIYKTKLNSNSFRKTTFFISNKTTIIDNSIISYSKKLNLIFCFIYIINLTKSNYIKYLKIRYNYLLLRYKSNFILNNIVSILRNIDNPNLKLLVDKLKYNRIYFKNLFLNL